MSSALPPVVERTRFFRHVFRPDLPPFQRGAAGLWSYELNRAFEDVPPARSDDLQMPLLGALLLRAARAAGDPSQ